MSPILFRHLRAALKSAAHFRHEITDPSPEVAATFDGAKTGVRDHVAARQALEACPVRSEVVSGLVEGLKCSTTIDASGPGMILRQITMPKDAPYAEPSAFEALIQRWHLDLQVALDMALTSDAWYGWIAQEPCAPYACQLFTPTAALLESGKEKLAKALAVARSINDTADCPAYKGVTAVGIPGWRAKELGINLNE